MNYRRIPRVANSDLTELKNFLGGRPLRTSHPAQAYGTQFHTWLEMMPRAAFGHDLPWDAMDIHSPGMLETLHGVASRNDALFTLVHQEAAQETPIFWEDEVTQLPCKALLDLHLPQAKLIVDVKTTSCASYADFAQTCQTYEYDRQAAFYLDGGRAERFVLSGTPPVGIQKQPPYQLYTLESSLSFLQQGRRAYRALLARWQEINYRPTSWAT